MGNPGGGSGGGSAGGSSGGHAAALVVRGGGLAVHLAPGQELTFGRTRDGHDQPHLADALTPAGAPAVHLGLSPRLTLHAVAGQITADAGRWVLANTGRWLHLRLTTSHSAERADVAPGRSVPVTWPSSRIEIATGDETLTLDVECPGAVPGPALGSGAGDTVPALNLDRSAGYFRALVALCEPRLRDPGSDAVPAASDIARRLNASGRETERVTAKGVERRLAHARVRAGITPQADAGASAAGLEIRDAARRLADLALRTGIVTVADLGLLEPAPLKASPAQEVRG